MIPRRSALLALAISPFLHAHPVTMADTPHYRPGYHFTPRAHWMNDPNGLVFHQGVYHLFFQHYPHDTVWGPMHWGHATSTDLLHWQEQPIALAPDELGWIFSGSAVVDAHNSAGLGPAGSSPLVAIFTHHDGVADQAGRQDIESQSLAHSLDGGHTWVKYPGNPVLPSPGTRDFRDPKVFWHAPSARWVMSLATGQTISFYASRNLKDWAKLSEFGAGQGAHDGVWECPDLFPLQQGDQTHWVLLVSLVKGGPAGGSATQYFVGQFDGQRFVSDQPDTRWLDHGADNYAGVTYAHTEPRRVFVGWMSNWDYAKAVPTHPWRSAMTLPRELGLATVRGQWRVTSQPVAQARAAGRVLLQAGTTPVPGTGPGLDWSSHLQAAQGQLALNLHTADLKGFSLVLSNPQNERLALGYDASARQFFVDRSQAGPATFHPSFAARQHAPRLQESPEASIEIYLDACSVELFADGGLSVITDLFFASQPFDRLQHYCSVKS